MPESEHAERLRKYLEQVLEGRQIGQIEGGLESMTGAEDPRMSDDALRGLESIEAGTELTDTEMGALEAIVLPNERPVLDVIADTFHDPPTPWGHLAAPEHRALIEAAILSVGRIEVFGHPSVPYGGTGFVVGEGLLMTNRHVAAIFASGLGGRGLSFQPGITSGVDFKQEVIPSPPEVLQVDEVVMIHPYWDCALLRVPDLPAPRKPLALAGTEPEQLARDVVVIGYPAQDARNDVDLQNRIFRGIFQRKRLQPGKVRDYQPIDSFGKTVEAVTHDSSTLGGNSGSLVLDLETGQVLGLHFAGRYLEANFAVPAWELATDARVRDVGVVFQPVPDTAAPSAWDSYWLSADPEAAAPAATAPLAASAPAKDASKLALDWYERTDDATLQEALAIDPEETMRRLEAALGPAEAAEVAEDLTAVAEEGLFSPRVNPDFPEIVYLHGIMGGHLAAGNGTGSRVWVNPFTLAGGSVAGKLSLTDDGLTGSEPGLVLGPDGHVRTFYARAARKWRRRGFVVHEIAYDWRKPIHTAADRLHTTIEGLAAGHADRKFALVAHSMGGLVASLYAARHPEWENRIERAVFAGSPLGGSYAPIEAVLGVYPALRIMAAVSLQDDIDDLRALAAGLPGLLEMLPHPDLFTDPLDCYGQDPWPAANRPLASWLAASRASKTAILESPLLARTSGIVSRLHGTVASVVEANGGVLAVGPRTGPGDGTVPVKAAAVSPLGSLYEGATQRHATLLRDDAVIAGVGDLLERGSTDALTSLALDDIDFDAVVESPVEAIALEAALEAPAEGVKARLREGRPTAADLDYLFDPLGAPPPG